MTPRTRHVPMRRCVRCRATAPKADLVRLVRDAERGWRLDPSGKTAGRGAWICPECAARASERELKRAFKGSAATVAAELGAHLSDRRPAREGMK